MDTLRGYKIKNRKDLSHWSPVLEEWLLAIERYCRIMKGDDAPYWYNERANISILSGAAWRSGRIALEEFQSLKGYVNQKKSRGRTDLWIASEHSEEIIESKFKWLSVDSKKMSDIVQDEMNKAVDDAKRSKASCHGLRAIGVGFFPVYAMVKHIDSIDDKVHTMIAAFMKEDYHALA